MSDSRPLLRLAEEAPTTQRKKPLLEEAATRRECVAWLDNNYPNIIRHGNTGQAYAGQSWRRKLAGYLEKKAGALAGWPDLFIYHVGAKGQPGLAIEFKSTNGKVSTVQKGVGIRLQQAGYTWVVVRSLDLFKIIVNRYMRVTIRTPNVIVLDDDDDDDEVEYIGWARSLDGWPLA